jgi:hypothetical protein
MPDERTSLTGAWHGRYGYHPEHQEPPVSFTATLWEAGGFVTGVTEEAQLVSPAVSAVMRAMLNGVRDGEFVRFEKTYDGTQGWDHTVDYGGEVSPDGLEIHGHWELQDWVGWFLMVRDDGLPEAVREAETVKV